MGSVSIILRRPPYGSVDTSEAIRHALGGVTNAMDVNLILVDGGVAAARKGQDVSGTEYSSIEEGIKDCMDMGAVVYADKDFVEAERLKINDFAEGVRIINSSEIAEIIANSDTTMIF